MISIIDGIIFPVWLECLLTRVDTGLSLVYLISARCSFRRCLSALCLFYRRELIRLPFRLVFLLVANIGFKAAISAHLGENFSISQFFRIMLLICLFDGWWVSISGKFGLSVLFSLTVRFFRLALSAFIPLFFK